MIYIIIGANNSFDFDLIIRKQRDSLICNGFPQMTTLEQCTQRNTGIIIISPQLKCSTLKSINTGHLHRGRVWSDQDISDFNKMHVIQHFIRQLFSIRIFKVNIDFVTYFRAWSTEPFIIFIQRLLKIIMLRLRTCSIIIISMLFLCQEKKKESKFCVDHIYALFCSNRVQFTEGI